MNKVSVAAAPVTPTPLTVPVMALVVLGNAPLLAPAGTSRVTLKVQEASGARLAPVNVSPPVSLTVPLQKLCGSPVAARPVSVAERSSVKVIAVAEKLRSGLVIVNSSVAVPPGLAGSSVKNLVSSRSDAATVSAADAEPESPPSLARFPDTFTSVPTAPPMTSL